MRRSQSFDFDTPPISGFSLWSVDLCRPPTHPLSLHCIAYLLYFKLHCEFALQCGFMQTTDTPAIVYTALHINFTLHCTVNLHCDVDLCRPPTHLQLLHFVQFICTLLYTLWSVDLCRPPTHLQRCTLLLFYIVLSICTFHCRFALHCVFMQTTDTPTNRALHNSTALHCTQNAVLQCTDLKLREDLQVARAKTSVVDLQWVQLGRRDVILPRFSSFALVVGGH